MKLFDFTDPFFEPLWVRVVVVAVCVAWGLFEFSRGSLFWGMFFVGLGAISGWRFATIDYAALAAAKRDAEQD